MIHDPHCPAPEMCSECGEFPVADDHDCMDYPVCLDPFILGSSAILWGLIIVIGWSLWTALKYGGWVR